MYQSPAEFIRTNWRTEVKKYLPYLIAGLVGVVFADKIRALPGLSKLPSF